MNPSSFLAFFFLFNLVLIFITSSYPIGDFGNYYYGSKVWLDGKDLHKLYSDIHWFNEEIRLYGENNYFENYIPVPPFSLIFYWPFTFIEAHSAKLLFNLSSLIIYCFSFYRLLKQINYFNTVFYVLPFIFLYPLYSNFQQGQSYLIITALCIEFYLAIQDQNKKTAAFIIALLFSLKIYPAFLGIFLLIRRDWKGVSWILLFVLLLQGLVFCVLGKDVFLNYYLDIMPRLALNEITDPFSFRNQSWHTFLLQVFIEQPSNYPKPLFYSVLAACCLQLLMYATLFAVLIQSVLKQNSFRAFAILLLVLSLMNKYSSVYGLLIFLPFCFLVKDLSQGKILILGVLLFVICNLPVFKLGTLPLFFKFTRLWLLLCLLVLLADGFKWSHFFMSLAVFLLPSLIFFKYKQLNELVIEHGSGILYDFKIDGDSLALFTCAGHHDKINYYGLEINKVDSTSLSIRHSKVFLLNDMIYESKGQIKKAILINDSSLFVMSDENRAVGMFALIQKNILRKTHSVNEN